MKHTEANITRQLQARYCAPEWAYFAGVPNTTGGGSRIADGVAMNLYPSNNWALHCFEIKVSRADFLNEINDPNKSEVVGKHCDYFTLVIPAGLVSKEELPKRWGLLEVTGDKLGDLYTRQKPQKQESVAPLTRGFVAAILRRACEASADTKIVDEINRKEIALNAKEQHYEKLMADHAERHRTHEKELKERVQRQEEREKQFQETAGIFWQIYGNKNALLPLFLKAATHGNMFQQIKELHKRLNTLSLTVSEIVTEFGEMEKETGVAIY